MPSAILSLPVTSTPPMTTTAGAPSLSGPISSAALTPPISAPIIFTPEEMMAALRELSQAVSGIRTFLSGPYAQQPPAPFATIMAPQQQPW